MTPSPSSSSLSLDSFRSAREIQQKQVRGGGREPWRAGDVSSLLTLNAVGLALLVAGWSMAAGRVLFHDQVSGANVAIAGIIVAGVGNGVWLLTGRRAVGLRRRTMAGAIEQRYRRRPQPIAEETTTFVAAKGMTRYHRHDCVFVVDRKVTARRRQTHESQGRTPCGACRP
jgi:hypothetical protein